MATVTAKKAHSKRKASAIGVTIRIRKGKHADALVLDVVDRGQRTREHLGLYLTGDRDKDRETMLLAEQIKAKRLRERAVRRSGFEEMHLRLDEDFLLFYDDLMKDRGKPWKNVRAHLTRFCTVRPRFGDIGESWIDGFRRHLEQQGLRTNSIATYMDVLKTSFNVAVRRKIIAVNPFVYTRSTKRVRTNREFLTVDELRMLWASEAEHDMVKRSFLFACLTGLRISDLKQIRWQNILDTEIRIVQKKTGDHITIPLSEQARQILPEKGTAKNGDLIFAYPSRDDVYNDRLLKWIQSVGIKKHVTSHVARHTFATLLVTQGTDLYAVQHLLGHRDLRVTQIYAKLVDQRKVDAIKSLPLL